LNFLLVEGGQSLGSIVEGGQTGWRRITDGPLERGGYPLCTFYSP